jgi:hypothetical protein
VVAGDTRYLDAALAQVHAAGDTVKPEDVKRLSPPLLDHVNVLGRYDFALTESIRRGSYDRFAAPTSRMIWLHRKPYAGFLFLCGQVGYVASIRSMPRIQLVLELERHITISLTDSHRLAQSRHVSPATTTLDAGGDYQIRATSWADPGVDRQDSGHSEEGGGELGTLPSGTGTR